MRGALAALLLLGGTALAGDKALTHFPEVLLAKLQVMQLIDGDALVEGPNGDVVLVRVGDVLGREQARVIKVSQGCVSLKVGRSAVALCADAPEAPRS